MANLFKRYESESYPGHFCVVCEDDVECGNRYGWGSSLEEARLEWGEKLVERVDDHIYDLRQAGVIDAETADASFEAIDELEWLPW